MPEMMSVLLTARTPDGVVIEQFATWLTRSVLDMLCEPHGTRSAAVEVSPGVYQCTTGNGSTIELAVAG